MSQREAKVSPGHMTAKTKLSNAFVLSAGEESQTRQVLGVASERPGLLSPLVSVTWKWWVRGWHGGKAGGGMGPRHTQSGPPSESILPKQAAVTVSGGPTLGQTSE